MAAAVFAGCGTSAAVNGGVHGHVEGRIVGVSGSDLVLESRDNYTAIPRESVVEVDHPGNVLATIGGLLAGYGVANVIVGLPKCAELQDSAAGDSSYAAGFCVGVFAPLIAGAAMTIYGLVTWTRSTKAMDTPVDEEVALRLGPGSRGATRLASPKKSTRPPAARTGPSAPVSVVTATLVKSPLGVELERGESGVVVRGVLAGYSAASAGILPGDVLVSVDGASIKDPADLPFAVSEGESDGVINVVVIRNGELRTLQVRLLALPSPEKRRPLRAASSTTAKETAEGAEPPAPE